MMLLCTDKGHGGADPGAVANDLMEKNLTLEIGNRVDERLKEHGFQVITTRTTDIYVGLSERAAMANRSGADYFLSIHINAGGGTGFESYIQKGTYSDKQNTERLRTIIHNSVAAYFVSKGMPDRGKKEANLAVTRETAMPACLLECGFIDSSDALKLADPNFRLGLAEAIVKGVCAAFNVAYVPPQSIPVPASSEGLWTVQVGAFRERANADRLCNELKSKGYQAFVYRKEVN